MLPCASTGGEAAGVQQRMTSTPEASRPEAGSARGATARGESLQVLDRAFAILAQFTREHPEWTTTEIARACELPIPTAHRILTTLRAHGFLTRDEAKRFRLGPAAMELGERAQEAIDLRTVSMPILQRLAEESGETALLTVLNDTRDRSVCLERVESTQPLRLSVEAGRTLPLHAGASQKILLAYMPADETERILSGALERVWRATITRPDTLRADLALTRRRGWAQSFEETNGGTWGLAVPILDQHDEIVAGIGLAGPSARLTKESTADHLQRLDTAAEEIARMIGLRVAADVDAAQPEQRPAGRRPVRHV